MAQVVRWFKTAQQTTGIQLEILRGIGLPDGVLEPISPIKPAAAAAAPAAPRETAAQAPPPPDAPAVAADNAAPAPPEVAAAAPAAAAAPDAAAAAPVSDAAPAATATETPASSSSVAAAVMEHAPPSAVEVQTGKNPVAAVLHCVPELRVAVAMGATTVGGLCEFNSKTRLFTMTVQESGIGYGEEECSTASATCELTLDEAPHTSATFALSEVKEARITTRACAKAMLHRCRPNAGGSTLLGRLPSVNTWTAFFFFPLKFHSFLFNFFFTRLRCNIKGHSRAAWHRHARDSAAWRTELVFPLSPNQSS